MRNIHPRLLWLAIVALVLNATLLLADPIGYLNLETLLADAQQLTTNSYPDADAVILDDVIRTVYQADGRYITVDDTAVKILTEKGRREHRILSESYTASYGRLSFELVQVISKDGKVHNIDLGKNVSEMVDSDQMSSNIFDPNQKKVRVNIPGLEVGDIVRSVVCREVFKPRVPNFFGDFNVLEWDVPIRHTTIEIDAPKSRPLVHKVVLSPIEGTVQDSVTENGDRILYKWTVSNVPQAFRESAMPPLWACAQRLLVSTTETWEEVSRWYWNLCLPHLTPSPEMKEKVRQLTANTSSREEKLHAIFHFVSQEIRYMGETTETEAPGYEPHDVAATFAQRHGVCRDKAALLAVMLREAGFDAFPVLFNADNALKDKVVPLPYFNHAITGVLNPDGTYQLMDSTDEDTSDLFPAYLSNMSYLVARPDGDTLRTSPIIPAEENNLLIKTSAAVSPNGTLTGFTTLDFLGINDNAYRGFFARHTPDQQKTLLENALNRTLPGARLDRFQILPEKILDSSTPLRVELSYTAANFLAANGNAPFQYPRFSAQFGVANWILQDTSLDKRRFPFRISAACAIRETSSIAFAPACGAPSSLPEYTSIERDNLLWKRSLTWENGALHLSSEFALRAVEYSPEEYLQLKQDIKAMEFADSKLPFFDRSRKPETNPPAPDAAILEDTCEIALQDAFSWEESHLIRMQILTYNGKRNYSEIELSHHPAFEELELEYARVINGVQEVKYDKKGSKLMDAPWVASASDYPAEKILVANLPAVQVGSIIEYKYRTRTKNGPLFQMVQTFRSMIPVQQRTLKVTVPNSLTFLHETYQNGILFSRKGENIAFQRTAGGNNTTVYTWSSERQPALPQEQHLPRLRNIVPTVALSCASWNQISRLYQSRIAQKHTSPAVEQVTKAFEHLPTLRKLRAIRNYVATRIRVAGPDFTMLPISAISTPEQTLARGYGNEVDRAILLAALLRAAGFQPDFWFANNDTLPELGEKELLTIPDASLFASPLLRVKTKERLVFLNDTDQYAELGTCAHEGKLALTHDGKFQRIAVEAPFRDKWDVSQYVTLAEDGSARVTVTRFYRGTAYGSQKKFYEELTPEKRRRHFLSLLDELSSSAVADGDLVTDFTNYPGRVQFSAHIPDFAVLQNGQLYTQLPSPAGGLIQASGLTRSTPYLSPVDICGVFRLRVTLPQAFPQVKLLPFQGKLSFPKGADNAFCKTTTELKNGVFTAVTEYDVKPFILTASSYPELLSLLTSIRKPSYDTILLAK
ncbi:MAG: DUF3857 domain-containing protein [Victivallales bacterium]|nr:DUF3857 domain-containing protein [Victivallales bacterium]